jgi:hypothetical protein
LGSHNHLIHRKEAREVIGFGTLIENAAPETEAIITDLYAAYSEQMELNKPFDPQKIISGSETEKVFSVTQAYVESLNISHVFETPYLIQLNAQTHQINVQPKGLPAWNTEKQSVKGELK